MPTSPTTRAALYARVSTHHGQDVGLQLDALREIAAARGWVEAGDLQINDVLRNVDGGLFPLRAVERLAGTYSVFNIEVEGAHTFHVGMAGLLVHNKAMRYVPSKRSHYTSAQLPTKGKVRYVPPKNWHPTEPLPRGPNHGYMDKFGNEWTKKPSQTNGQPFEWDVQRPDGSHWNISLDGKVTH